MAVNMSATVSVCFGAVVGTTSIKQLTRSSHQMHTGNQFNYSCYRYRTGSKIILCRDESHPTELIFFSLVLHCGGGVKLYLQNRNHICVSRRRESITFVVAIHSVATTRFTFINNFVCVLHWTDYKFCVFECHFLLLLGNMNTCCSRWRENQHHCLCIVFLGWLYDMNILCAVYNNGN